MHFLTVYALEGGMDGSNMYGTMNKSFKGSVSWTLGGTDTGLTMSGGFVWKWEFAQISSDHVEFDFYGVEQFSIVNSDDTSNHFWHNDAISKVGFDYGWLLSGKTVLFSLNAFHIESVISMFDFYVYYLNVLLWNLLLCLALKSSTTCSVVRSLICSGV